MPSPQMSATRETMSLARRNHLAAEAPRLSRLLERESDELARCHVASNEDLWLQQLIVTVAAAMADEAATAAAAPTDQVAPGESEALATGRSVVIPPLKVLRERALARLAAMTPAPETDHVALAG